MGLTEGLREKELPSVKEEGDVKVFVRHLWREIVNSYLYSLKQNCKD